ncbi:rho guanine nucleotide exchange factor 3-like [Lampetra fluviatilis]
MVAKDATGCSSGAKRSLDAPDTQPVQLRKEPEEPSNKRVRPQSRSSFASLISPMRSAARTLGKPLQRSASVRFGEGPSQQPSTGSRRLAVRVSAEARAGPSAAKRHDGRLWCETFTDAAACQQLSAHELKRQEVIFELFRGEHDLIKDLQVAKKAYHDPMLTLAIMTEEELAQIFGSLDSFIPLHEDLVQRLDGARQVDGSIHHVGPLLLDWLPCLSAYVGYCGNQLAAKALLDRKKQDPRVQDFLQRCLESPFSRRLELWSFLDVPRSRLVKYPLLLREILRLTPSEHADAAPLTRALDVMQGILGEMNTRAGESECRHYMGLLEYVDPRHRDPLIAAARSLCCHGELRNHRGQKLHVFLLDGVLVITRPGYRNGAPSFQVYRQPVPTAELCVQDLPDGTSFIRGPFGPAERGKHAFRVGFSSAARGRMHNLLADSAYNKQQWLSCLRAAASRAAPASVALPAPPTMATPPPTMATMARLQSFEDDSDMELSSQVGRDGYASCSDSESDAGSTMDTSEWEKESGSRWTEVDSVPAFWNATRCEDFDEQPSTAPHGE